MITIRPAKYSDIDDICHDISKISFSEMVDCGVEHAWHAKMRARLCMRDVGLECLFVNDKPMWAFGGVNLEGKLRTWFIAVEDFWKAPPSVWRASTEHMKRFAKTHQRYTIEAVTTSQQPMLRRWFKLFGFNEHQRLEKCTIFRYGPTKMTGVANSAKTID